MTVGTSKSAVCVPRSRLMTLSLLARRLLLREVLSILRRPNALKMGLVGDGLYSKASLPTRRCVPASLITSPAFSNARTPNGSGSSRGGNPKPSFSLMSTGSCGEMGFPLELDLRLDHFVRGIDVNVGMLDDDKGCKIIAATRLRTKAGEGGQQLFLGHRQTLKVHYVTERQDNGALFAPIKHLFDEMRAIIWSVGGRI